MKQRLDFIKLIAVIGDGHIAEMGSYGGLITIKDGIFCKLMERQTIVA
jgi:ABC-type multidrug transport system fused ATPase/permease subunit